MELSPHVKWWLAQASGPKSNEVRNYIKFLEDELGITRGEHVNEGKESTPVACPSCGQVMKLRSGKFGEFYFCQDQHLCGQPTITKAPALSVTNCNHNIESIDTASNDLIYELKILEAGVSPLYSQSDDDEPFVNELGEPIYEYGEDYRPHG